MGEVVCFAFLRECPTFGALSLFRYAKAIMAKYNSSVIMGLEPIGRGVYIRFANHHLSAIGMSMSAAAFAMLYDAYDGVTWYVQYVLNMLYMRPARSVMRSVRG